MKHRRNPADADLATEDRQHRKDARGWPTTPPPRADRVPDADDDGLYELCTGHPPTNPSRQEGA